MENRGVVRLSDMYKYFNQKESG